MTLAACLVAALLWPIAALHVVWALGVPWPFDTETELARAVGGPALEGRIGRIAKFVITIMAAGAIAVSGLLPLLQANLLPNPLPSRVVFSLLVIQTAVFFLRGALGYTNAAPASAYEPFRTYNRRYYSPLIIFLGLLCVFVLSFS